MKKTQFECMNCNKPIEAGSMDYNTIEISKKHTMKHYVLCLVCIKRLNRIIEQEIKGQPEHIVRENPKYYTLGYAPLRRTPW